MAAQDPKVLIVEDVGSLAQTYMAFLSREPVHTAVVSSGESALVALEKSLPDVILMDVNLPGKSGIEVLQAVRQKGLPVAVIVMTSQGSINLAVTAMKEGAFDFLVKPFSAERLQTTTRLAIEHQKLLQRVEKLEDEFQTKPFCQFIGQSLPMQAVYKILRNAAKSRATVFVSGESGTGKELCALALHELSDRRDKPFVALNCAAIPRDLLESEIFGHAKGAFSGALTDRQGAALRANGGTLFLDEIGEMELSLQPKILRFLQTGMVQRVGEDLQRSTDVRIVAATNRNIRDEVAEGRFREDLFYRLYVIPLEMPALRERDGDVLLIAQHFLNLYAQEDGKDFKNFSPGVQDVFLRYGWPGNVRELQNAVRNIVVLNNGETITLADLPADLLRTETAKRAAEDVAMPRAPSTGLLTPLEVIIDSAIDAAIARCGGSIPRAAHQLQVSPSTIYRRLQARTPK